MDKVNKTTGAQQNHKQIVRLLLEARVDVNKACDDGRTPIFIASQCGHVDIMSLLLRYGAKVNKAMDGGVTPLFICLSNRS